MPPPRHLPPRAATASSGWATGFPRVPPCAPPRAARDRGNRDLALRTSGTSVVSMSGEPWLSSCKRCQARHRLYCLRSPGLAALARGWWNDASASFHHLRHQEKIVLARRRIAENCLRIAAVRDLVRPLLHLHRRHRRHRRDALDIHFGKLLEEGENRVELALQVLDLVVGDFDAREVRDAAHGIGIDGHCEPRRHGKLRPAPYSRGGFAPATRLSRGPENRRANITGSTQS